MQKQLEKDLYGNFSDSIRSPATRRQYDSILKAFMKYFKMTKFSRLTAGSKQVRQQRLKDYVMAKRKEGATAHTCNVHLAALQHFYIFNDISDINWKLLRSFCGEHKKVVKDRAYTIEELRDLIKRADIRGRALLLFLVSTGCRIGALPELCLKHRTKLPDLKISKFVIYDGSKEEYWTLDTPEAEMYLDAYLEDRARSGEELNLEAPLFREQFDSNDKAQVTNPRHMAKFTIAAYVRNLTIRAGIRKPTHDKQKRQSIMLLHGFRKYYNTQMIRANVKPLMKELLIGHKTLGLESSYFRPTEDEIMKEYVKAIPNLTILSTSTLERELKETQKELARKSGLERRVDFLEGLYAKDHNGEIPRSWGEVKDAITKKKQEPVDDFGNV